MRPPDAGFSSRRPLAALAALAIIAFAPTATAAPASARALIEEARQRYDQADFEGALESLDRAARLASRGLELGSVLAERALVAAELQGIEEARRLFTEALRQSAAVCPTSRRAKGNLVMLCNDLREAGRASVAVEGTGRGREIFVDGKAEGSVPRLLELPIGVRQIEVRGRVSTIRRRVELALGQRLTIDVPAEPEARPATAPSAPVSPAPPRRRYVWSWVMVATAAALGAASLGCWLGADREYASWRDLATREPPPADLRAQLDPIERSVRRLEYSSIALLSTAAVSAAVAGLLFWYEGRESRRAADTARSISVRPGIGAVRVEF